MMIQHLPAPLSIQRLFPFFMLGYVFLWVLVSAFMHSAYGYDVLLALVVGREWQLGTFQHPTLPIWIIEIFWQLGGDFGMWVVLPIFSMLTLVAIYFLAKNFVSTERAFLSALLVGICLSWRSFDNVPNHNTLQPLFWVLVIYLFHLCLTQKKLHLWVLLGITAAACFWVKYSAVFLLLCVPLWLLCVREDRANFKTAGPWVSLVVFLGCVAPHFYFLIKTDFLLLEYAQRRSAGGSNIFKFLMSQALTQLPLVAALGVGGFLTRAKLKTTTLQREDKFILVFAFLPVAFLFVFSFVGELGLRTQWGYSFFPLWGLVAMRFLLPAQREEVRTKRAFYFLLLLMLGTPLAHGLYLYVRPYYLPDDPSRLDYPQKQLAREVEQHFTKITGEQPLLLMGYHVNAGAAATGMKSRPRFMFSEDLRYSTWIDLNADREFICRSTALIWREEGLLAAPLEVLKHCGVKNPQIIQFKVPFPRYPKAAPLFINMIVISKKLNDRGGGARRGGGGRRGGAR